MEAPNVLRNDKFMCTVSSVKIDIGWLYQATGCTIGRMGMKVQYASPWTTPTCIIIMTNVTSNVVVRSSTIPKLAVTIVTMSISFQSQPPHLRDQGIHDA
jgi:hypothetical protein